MAEAAAALEASATPAPQQQLVVKLFPERTLRLTVNPANTMQQVAQQVRDAGAMPVEQHMRFICAGQELFAEDSVAEVLGCVVHCIASSAPARRQPGPRGDPAASKPHQPSASPDVLDPGTVLLAIFGSILALLWLLLACFGHMFDKTSVVMLVMMTLSFLVPCCLSFAPAVRVLDRFAGSSTAPTRGTSAQRGAYALAAPWQQQQQHHHHSGAMDSGWGHSGIPPRPHAPRARLLPATGSR